LDPWETTDLAKSVKNWGARMRQETL
jgi:hypothetical protein